MRIGYDAANVNDMKVLFKDDLKGRPVVDGLSIGGRRFLPSGRFWNSLFSRFGIGDSVFKYFSHEEVFCRISDVARNSDVRFAYEERDGECTLLAATNPAKPLLKNDDVLGLLKDYSAEKVSYSNGVVTSWHSPRIGSSPVSLNGDEHKNKFIVQTPIDGYGLPNVYIGIMRLVCSNGLVAMGKAFRSSLALGKDGDVAEAMVRVLENFNSDEGYAALHERLTVSANSPASLFEVQKLYKVLVKCIGSLGDDDKKVSSKVLSDFHRITGDPIQLYGISNLDALAVKKQRLLRTNCSVYQLINMATELATHHFNDSTQIHGFVGELLVNEFDLENVGGNLKSVEDTFFTAV